MRVSSLRYPKLFFLLFYSLLIIKKTLCLEDDPNQAHISFYKKQNIDANVSNILL